MNPAYSGSVLWSYPEGPPPTVSAYEAQRDGVFRTPTASWLGTGWGGSASTLPDKWAVASDAANAGWTVGTGPSATAADHSAPI